MTATNPIEIDGKEYALYSLNLAITGKYVGDGSSDASIAARFIPTRVENGDVEMNDSGAKCFALGSISGSDEPTLTAVAEISAALQKFIISKGL